jgi:hypothetical protein
MQKTLSRGSYKKAASECGRLLFTVMSKTCRDCGLSKPLSEFSPSRKNKDGHASYCRPCFSLRGREYRRRRAAADGKEVRRRPKVPPGSAHCSSCEQTKPLTDFGTRSGNRTGRTAYCKACHSQKSRESRVRRHGDSRNYHLMLRYGITSADYDRLVEQQGGVCALCRERPTQHVDHDHVTGRVRGVLCFCCNQGLGNFRDRADIMRAAIEHLESTTWQRSRICTGVYRLTPPRPDALDQRSSSA